MFHYIFDSFYHENKLLLTTYRKFNTTICIYSDICSIESVFAYLNVDVNSPAESFLDLNKRI